MKDMYNNLKIVPVLAPQSKGADGALTHDTAVDRNGWDSCVFVMHTGACDATNYATLTLTESDTASNFTAVADGDLIGLEADTKSDNANYECAKLGYIGNKRYVKATVTVEFTDAAVLVSALAILGSPRLAPRDTQIEEQQPNA